MAQDKSGPAFPVVLGTMPPSLCTGMTLRQFYTGCALIGVASRWPTMLGTEEASVEAHAYADAVIAEEQGGK